MGARLVATVLAAGAVTLVAAPALGAATPKRTIDLFDNYYAPAKATVKQGTQVTWHWDESMTDVHDVQLVSAPKGVKKFQTDPLAAGLDYRRKLTVPGLYKFICSFHEEEMTMQLRVRRAPRKARP